MLLQGTAIRTIWPVIAIGLLSAFAPASAQTPNAPASGVQSDAPKPAPSSTKHKPKGKLADAKAGSTAAPAPTANSDKGKSKQAKSAPVKPDKAKPEKSATHKTIETKPEAKAAKAQATEADKKSKTVAKKPARGKTGAPAASLAPPIASSLQPSMPAEANPVSVAPSSPAPSGASQQSLPAPANSIITAAAIDVSAVKRAVEMVRNHKTADAGEVRKNISDPVAKKLVEWVILRSDDSGSDFGRYTAFITANPTWPSIVTLRRKAEAAAFQDQAPAAQVQSYFSQFAPLSAKGRFAYARALMANGNKRDAEGQVREAWRYDGFSQDVESRALDTFGEFITAADNKARMDRRLYEKDDTEAGLRAAQRLGGNDILIAKARISAWNKGSTKAALDAVPAAARNDIGYKFAHFQMLRRADDLAGALAVLKTVPKLDRSHDLDEWWRERRVLARKLLDNGDAKEAYAVANEATTPENPTYRSEQHFMAGWIALRFLHDPATAYAHFLKVSESNDNPISLARGAYWSGRAAEALHKTQEARQHYQDGARYPTAYYGQIARAKAGLGELTLNAIPALSSAERNRALSSDIVKAAELLYATDARDLAWAMMADLGDKSTDVGLLAALSELTAKYRDARGMLLVGKLALARGLTLDLAAFPNFGVPDYTPIGPPVEPPVVYSIVRQESWFNPKTVSSANALGLMQVTPAAGQYVAKKFKATFDQKRLLGDQTYNVQMGSAELGDVIRDYRGSYIMAFAAYNAGRGRLREWIGKYGDPRDPNVDPIDWVERIPFSETRNYVQRVLENVQVYRVRFGGAPRLLIEADLRRGSESN